MPKASWTLDHFKFNFTFAKLAIYSSISVCFVTGLAVPFLHRFLYPGFEATLMNIGHGSCAVARRDLLTILFPAYSTFGFAVWINCVLGFHHFLFIIFILLIKIGTTFLNYFIKRGKQIGLKISIISKRTIRI